MSWLVLQDSAHTQTYNNAEQLHCQSYSTILPPQTIHCNHTMLTQKHLFLLPLHFCLTMRILNEIPQVHKLLPLSRVCHKHALDLQALLQRQPRLYTTSAQYWFMPDLIKLWKNSMAEANKYFRHTKFLYCTPSPYAPPKWVYPCSFPGQLCSLSTQCIGKPGHLNSRDPWGKLWPTQVGAEEKQLLGACPAPSFYLF